MTAGLRYGRGHDFAAAKRAHAGYVQMSARIERFERGDGAAAAAHDDDVEKTVVRLGVRRHMHAATKIAPVGDGHRRDAGDLVEVAVDTDAHHALAIALDGEEGVEGESEGAAEELGDARAVDRVDDHAGEPERTDVDEMAH